MSHHLEVRVANPVADCRLGTSEKVIENGNFMT